MQLHPHPLFDLSGRIALVTGASRGIGEEIARILADHGAHVIVSSRKIDGCQAVAESIRAGGGSAEAVACHIGDMDQIAAIFDHVRATHGRLDILVNNAGIIEVGPIEDLPLDAYERAMATMYWGTVYPTFAVVPSMRARGDGRIVNITSIGGKLSIPHLAPYSSAKFAAVGFSEGLRAELPGSGVSVTTVVPGLMRTGSHLNARFGGRAPEEATWFALGATLPGITIGGEHAARAVVDATRRRRPIAVLGLPARAAMWLHGLFPGFTVRALGLVGRFLLPSPAGPGRPQIQPGREALRDARFPFLDRLTALGRAAADRNNEHPGPSPTLARNGDAPSRAPRESDTPR